MARKPSSPTKGPAAGAAPGLADEREALRRRLAAAQEEARQLAIAVARVMSDDRCEDILVLDVRGLSGVCDFFVIATGTSERQMRAVCEHVEDMARARGQKPYSVTGAGGASWIVLDYVDVVAHVFSADHRRYYELETLWGDAPQVPW